MPCRLRRAVLAALCLFLLLPTPARGVSTSAASAILMDARSGRVLYALDPEAERSIASITKLLTALVAAERTPDLDETVAVDPAAVGVEGSSIYLRAGEELSVRDLLYGLLLQSGNDAAVALAIACAGDVPTFVGWMNDRAEQLGMAHSHFANPNGLEAEGHYSSAHDMARLAQVVLQNDDLAPILATRSIRLGDRWLTNHNKLLWRYEGCIGLKTGYTQKAGRTLVSAAQREGLTLIAVTLHDPNDWEDHIRLLDYGFQNWSERLLARAGKVLALAPLSGSLRSAVPVATARDVTCCLARGERVTARFDLPGRLEAPVSRGNVLGALTFYLEGREVGSTPLVAAADAPADPPGGLWSRLGPVVGADLSLFAPGLPLWRAAMCQQLPL